MMLTLLFSLVSSAQASCTYQLNQSQLYLGDRSIFFGDYLNQKIQAKGYLKVQDGNAPDYIVDMSLNTLHGDHFDHVRADLSMVEVRNDSTFTKSADTTCYTQFCIAKDGAKVIRKSIDDFGKNLSVCQP